MAITGSMRSLAVKRQARLIPCLAAPWRCSAKQRPRAERLIRPTRTAAATRSARVWLWLFRKPRHVVVIQNLASVVFLGVPSVSCGKVVFTHLTFYHIMTSEGPPIFHAKSKVGIGQDIPV